MGLRCTAIHQVQRLFRDGVGRSQQNRVGRMEISARHCSTGVANQGSDRRLGIAKISGKRCEGVSKYVGCYVVGETCRFGNAVPHFGKTSP